MQKVSFGAQFHHFRILEPECEKCAKSAKRATFEHLGSLLPPFPPARPGQLWETSGRRSPDVSQTSLSLGLSGWLPQAGGERGRVGGCSPHSYHRRWVIW